MARLSAAAINLRIRSSTCGQQTLEAALYRVYVNHYHQGINFERILIHLFCDRRLSEYREESAAA